MKTFKFLALAALLVLVAVPFAGAQVGVWDTGMQIVNMSTTDATVTVTFYDVTGAAFTPADLGSGLTNPFTLGGGNSQTILVSGIPSLADGAYSVVVSADQPIVAIANLIGNNDPIFFNGSYSGMEDVGQMAMYMPSVNKDFYGWDSHLSLQNLTNAAMDVTVNFYAGSPVSIYDETMSVEPYSSWHVDVGALAGVPSDFNGSVVATAAGAIAAVDNQTADAYGFTQDYNGFPAGAMTLYCPALYAAFYTWDSSLNVQNIGTNTTTVTIEYSDGVVVTQDLGPNAAYLAYQPLEGHTETTFSAEITADQPLVAIVNAANPASQAQTYGCFSAGADSWYAPIVEKDFYGWFSGSQVQNITASDIDVTVEYEGGCTRTETVPAGGTYIFSNYDEPDACIPVGYGGSASFTGTGDFVLIVNQTYAAGQTGTMGDWSMSYNGFPASP